MATGIHFGFMQIKKLSKVPACATKLKYSMAKLSDMLTGKGISKSIG